MLRSVLSSLDVRHTGTATRERAAEGRPEQGRPPRLLLGVAAAAALLGLVMWLAGSGVLALWSLAISAGVLAWALPLPYALASVLFLGVLGWLVDMLPIVTLAGWGSVCARWVVGLVREKRLPRGGRMVWIPTALFLWTILGITAITAQDLRHFLLLLAMQGAFTVTILMVIDALADPADRLRLIVALVSFVVLMTVGVFAEWVGVPVQELQDSSVSGAVENAYGLDAFPNSLKMIKYVNSRTSGARKLRNELRNSAGAHEEVANAAVFKPKFQSFRTMLVVRFAGSARHLEDELERFDISLVYDNVGLAPAHTVPRMRSFPRNSLTYASTCVAVLPLAFVLVWTTGGIRRRLGYVGIAACLFGIGFSLARGAWMAAALGVLYIMVFGPVSRRRKGFMAGAFAVGALVLIGTFLVKYGLEPATARAEGKGSINTRATVYQETVASVEGIEFLTGFGTEEPRGKGGVSHLLGRYVPKAGSHSTYLNFLFRAGVPGALGIVAIYVLAGLRAHSAGRSGSGDERVVAALLGAALVSLAAHAAIQNVFVEPTYALVVAAVLGMGLAVSPNLKGLLP
ncbi:MAG: O-antigen ligase family protein, partial [Candidatus Rokuibacteriota bacterium]